MSLISPVADDLAVVHPPLAPVRLMEILAERGIKVMPVTGDEHETMGCYVVAVEPGCVVVANGSPGRARRWSRRSHHWGCRQSMRGRRSRRLPAGRSSRSLRRTASAPSQLRSLALHAHAVATVLDETELPERTADDRQELFVTRLLPAAAPAGAVAVPAGTTSDPSRRNLELTGCPEQPGGSQQAGVTSRAELDHRDARGRTPAAAHRRPLARCGRTP